MGCAFARMTNLISLGDLSKWDLSSVTGNYPKLGIFEDDENLESLGDISNWHFDSFQNILHNMFRNDRSIKHLDLSNWNTGNPNTNVFNYTFEGMESLESIVMPKTGTLTMKSPWSFRDITQIKNSHLKKITINSNVTKGFFDYFPIRDMTDPEIASNYTDKWQEVGTGTDEHPNGKVYTIEELANEVDNLTKPTTFVWQPITKIHVTIVDKNTGEVLESATDTDENIDKVTQNLKDLIANYEAKGYKVISNNFDNNGKLIDPAVVLEHKITTQKESKNVTQTIKYVDSNNNKLADDNVQTVELTRENSKDEVTGKISNGQYSKADFKDVNSPEIKGYKTSTKVVKGSSASENKTVTVKYSKDADVAVPITPTKPAIKNEAVMATNNIYMYKNATFDKNERIAHYVKTNRNHKSKTDGKIGYITANPNFTVKTYYQGMHKKIKVINPNGVNAYKNVNLTNKIKHYKKGQVLSVKKIVRHNLTTRFMLTNGSYVTGNSTLVLNADK